MNSDKNRVCPVERAHALDGKIRRWLHNPNRILSPFVKEGMKVLDVGCGPGLFSFELARLVGENGMVISADLQDGMLQKIRQKIQGTDLERRLTLVKCDENSINVTAKVDLILAFYMVHEVPDKNSLFRQFRSVLNNGGRLFLAEPRMFHVSRKEFQETLKIAEQAGFKIEPGPKIRLSWSAILV